MRVAYEGLLGVEAPPLDKLDDPAYLPMICGPCINPITGQHNMKPNCGLNDQQMVTTGGKGGGKGEDIIK
jgi:hypothetical protein